MSVKLKEERAQLKGFTPAQLRDKLVESKQELFNLRFMLATDTSQNNAEIRRVKKSIARIHTVLREKELKQS